MYYGTQKNAPYGDTLRHKGEWCIFAVGWLPQIRSRKQLIKQCGGSRVPITVYGYGPLRRSIPLDADGYFTPYETCIFLTGHNYYLTWPVRR